jgi:hypothetical protein
VTKELGFRSPACRLRVTLLNTLKLNGLEENEGFERLITAFLKPRKVLKVELFV